jgi:hypothetical protein
MSDDFRNKFFSQLSQIVSKTEKIVSVQSMTAGEGSEIRDNQQIVNLSLADRPFFFVISLKTEDGMEIVIDRELETDKIYRLYISVSPNPVAKSNLEQRGIKIVKQLDLSLQADDFEILDHRIISLQLKDWETWEEHFIVKVRNGSHGKTSLRLDFREGKADFAPYASLLDVHVRSLGNPISPPKTVKLTANISNAKNAAILYVIPNGEKEWLIQGISPHESIEQSIKVPSLPVNLWNYGKNYLGSILKWLRGTIAYFQDCLHRECNLAIIDATTQQIPWEMVELKPNEFLGVQSRVVRWIEQEAWGESILLDLDQKRNYQGRLVPYSHPVSLDCGDLHNCLKLWRKELRKHGQQPVAIALLHCEQELNKHLNQVRFDDLARCLQDRPLFLFVNSPCSARLLWQDENPHGIAANALSEIASGYFGTMGDVEGGLAQAIKKKFLQLAESDRGVSPALFLQGLRAFYKKFFTGTDLQKRQAEQIFSYVYYGNPDDVVKITGGMQP